MSQNLSKISKEAWESTSSACRCQSSGRNGLAPARIVSAGASTILAGAGPFLRRGLPPLRQWSTNSPPSVLFFFDHQRRRLTMTFTITDSMTRTGVTRSYSELLMTPQSRPNTSQSWRNSFNDVTQFDAVVFHSCIPDRSNGCLIYSKQASNMSKNSKELKCFQWKG